MMEMCTGHGGHLCASVCQSASQPSGVSFSLLILSFCPRGCLSALERDAAIAHYPVTQQFSSELLLKNTQVVGERCMTVTLSQWHGLNGMKRKNVTGWKWLDAQWHPLCINSLLPLLLVLMSSTSLFTGSVLLSVDLGLFPVVLHPPH